MLHIILSIVHVNLIQVYGILNKNYTQINFMTYKIAHFKIKQISFGTIITFN